MTPYYTSHHGTLYNGDSLAVLRTLPDESVQCCVTSPPYWGLRDYGVDGQIGLEATPWEHIDRLVELFREVRSVLKKDGTLWVNYGDTYQCQPTGSRAPSDLQSSNRGSANVNKRRTALPPKNLLGLPWRLALALQDDGWILRSDIIWHKSNPMPESCTDRPTRAHEYLFLFSKRQKYFYDHEAVKEPAAAWADVPEGEARPRPQNEQALSFARKVAEPERPGQAYEQHRPNRTPRPGVDTRGGNQGTGGIPYAKGNSKTFRGGGKYTRGQSHDNTLVVERESHGNEPNLTQTRNRRSVWTIPTRPCPEAHFATFPPALVKPCILAGSRPGDVVLDPFMGSGTTAMVARRFGRKWLGIELNPDYCELALGRIGVHELSLMDF